MLKQTLIIALALAATPVTQAVDWYTSTATATWQRVKSPKWSTSAQTDVVAISTDKAQVTPSPAHPRPAA